MPPSQRLQLSIEDTKTIENAFNEPVKIILLFKIMRKPNISSKELKNELYMSGTKIYYYLNQLSEQNKDNHAIIIAEEHKDETREHLIVKTYKISPWMEEIIRKEKIFTLYENDQKNKKWQFIALQKIGIALMTQQLNKFESKSEEILEKEIDSLPVYNFAFITQKTSDKMKSGFKSVFDELCSLEDQQKPLFEKLLASDYTIILNSTKLN